MSRRAHVDRNTRRGNSELVTLLMPTEALRDLDQHVSGVDTDRSKFIRQAVREKIARATASANPSNN